MSSALACVPDPRAAVSSLAWHVARISSSSPASSLAVHRALPLSFNIKDVRGVLYSPADVVTPLKLCDNNATEGEISPRAVVAHTHTHTHTHTLHHNKDRDERWHCFSQAS